MQLKLSDPVNESRKVKLEINENKSKMFKIKFEEKKF